MADEEKEPSGPAWRPEELVDASLDLLKRCIASFNSHGESRSGQVEMVRQVALALARGSRVAVKAGTGTGKSLGYLVPAVASGRRVVVVVSSLALQDQLKDKDLPFIEAIHGPFTWAVVKGRGRYICRAKALEAEGELSKADQTALFAAEEADDAKMDDETAAQVRGALEWMGSTASGDLAELPYELTDKTRRLLVSSTDECPGKDSCAQGEECFSEGARTRARESNIAVVNSSLFGADVAVDGALIGPADAVIVDEAHEAEDALASALSFSLSVRQLSALAAVAGRFVTKESKDEGAATPPAILRKRVQALRLLANSDSSFARALEAHKGKRLPKKGLAAMPDLDKSVKDVARGIAELARALESMEKFVSAPGTRARLGRAGKFATNLLTAVTALLDDPENDAMWVEEDGPALVRCPVQIGSILHRRAWKDRSVIFTSATLPPEYPIRLGFYQNDPYVDVGSPFDHRRQSRIYVPHLPEVKDPAWEADAWFEMMTLIRVAEGRTLALFTSHKNMRAFAERARADLPYPILVQGEAPKPALVEQFKADEHACLFASSSFFTGLDLPGKTCSLVIIDKIPFPRPDDPLWEARRDVAGDKWVNYPLPGGGSYSLKNSFATVDVPRAATLLAQAAGRLVRSERCRGVIMVCDPRLAGVRDNPKKWAYRHQILSELPPAVRLRDRAAAVMFLAEAVGREIPAAS